MRVKVNDGDGPVLFVQGLENGIRNGVVASESHDLGSIGSELVHARFDLANRLRDVERVDPEITGVDHLRERKRHRVLCRVVGAQKSG